MEQFLSRLIMDADDSVTQRRTMKELTVVRENITSEDEDRQTAGLLKLCNLLNMATSVTIASIRPNVFVPPVLTCLKTEHNVDLMLLAARALTYMVDAIASTVHVLGSEGGVEALLRHLQEVRDIEISEQCMTCVEKITQNSDCAKTVLQKGGVAALLGYVDFFSSSSQRTAWSSVAAMCRRVEVSTFHHVEASLSDIRARIDHNDGRIGEKAITCLYRIIVGVRSSPDLVASAFGDACLPLLSVLTRNDLAESTFTMTLVLVGAAISYSVDVTRRMIESGLVECLFVLVSRSCEHQKYSPISSPMHRMGSSPESLLAIDTFSGGMEGAEADATTSLATAAASQPQPPTTTTTTSALREKRITMEQMKTLCMALAALLPKITETYLAHGNVLSRLLMDRGQGSRSLRGVVFTEVNCDAEGGEEEEEEEEEEELFTTEELRARIFEEGIPLEKNPKYSKCKTSHVCDSCGKSCKLGDWFRCNKCDDFDLCGQCLLMNWEEHVEGSPRHTFCDMLELFPNTKQAAASAKLKGNGEDPLNTLRGNLYKDNPHLLDTLLVGLPRMVTLFNSTETHIVRNHTLAFIDRAVCLVSSHQLLSCGLSEAAVCEMIVAAMTDPSLVLNVQVMFLCRKLLEKLPSVYMSAFVREGVTNALYKVQGQNQQPVQRSGEDHPRRKIPLLERLHTLHDWRELVVEEAKSMLALFPSLGDETHILRLKRVISLLHDGHLQEAFDSLRLALLDDTTAYEISSSNVLHELRETLTRVNDVNVVIALVKTLAMEVPNALPALTRFVRHLQTVLSHLDQFHPPSFGDVGSIHVQIPVRLVPHSSDVARLKSTVATKSGLSRRTTGTSSGTATSSKETTTLKRSTRVATVRTGSSSTANTTTTTATTNNNSSNSSSSNNTTSIATCTTNTTAATTISAKQPASSSAALPAAKAPVEEREVTVSVEPLTNVETLMVFIASNVLSWDGEGGGKSGNRWRVDDDDQVEEVLPELGADGDGITASNQKAKKPLHEKVPPRVFIRLGTHVLPPSKTMLQLLQEYHTSSSKVLRRRSENGRDGGPSHRFLAMLEGTQSGVGNLITLHYSTVPFGPEYTIESPLPVVSIGRLSDPVVVKLPSEDIRPPAVLNVMRELHQDFPFSQRFLTVAQKDVLILLGTIYEALRNWPQLLQQRQQQWKGQEGGGGFTAAAGGTGFALSFPSTSLGEFIHCKLNNKAMRHCSNLLLAGQHLTTWAVNLALDCNFLFTATTRKFLFEVSFCGTLRSLVQMQESVQRYGVRDSLNVDHQFARAHRLHREKKRVWRDNALACAMQIMGKERVRGSVVLEFEYYNEIGSGSGPTSEFYSLVSDELRETKLRLWRRTDETPEDRYYRPHNGVYPLPLPPDSPEIDRVEPYFLLLGRIVARALLDQRVLPISFSPVLLKMLRGDDCGVHDLKDISESLGASIMSLSLAARNGTGMVQLPGSTVPCAVEDLGLDFTLPGDVFIELKKDGSNTPVTSQNLLEYCDAVTASMLLTGVERVVKAFRTGFNDYIPLYALRMLSVAELHEAICGHSALVTIDELEANCQADHGYTMTCRHVRQLFEIIASFNQEEQSRFFHFLTGSTHLPVGGLASLRPKFTIVRKTSSDTQVLEQEQLPSAMTCQNYLKLPAYDSKKQMEEKLRQSINEGCGAFLLT